MPKHDQQQQQHQPRGAADAVIPTDETLTPSPQPPLDGGVDCGGLGAGVAPELRYPAGVLIGREHQQQAAAAGVVSSSASASAAAAGSPMVTGVDAGYVVSPSNFSSSSYGGGGGGGGSSFPLFAPLPQSSTSRGVQHTHAFPSATSVGVESGGLHW